MTATIKQIIKLGAESYELVFIPVLIDGTTYIDTEKAIETHIALALKIVDENHSSKKITPEHMSFLLDTTGLKTTEIAKYLQMSPAHLSQYRKGKKVSSGSWQTFRIFLWDFFTNGKVTIPIFLNNYNAKKAA